MVIQRPCFLSEAGSLQLVCITSSEFDLCRKMECNLAEWPNLSTPALRLAEAKMYVVKYVIRMTCGRR